MPIERIVIMGGGLAAWLAASALARALGPGKYAIEIIDPGGVDNSIGPFVPALATLPSASIFHSQFGYSEDALIAETGGCFSLGSAVSGWTATGAPCFHPFGEIGAAMGHVAFHHLAARLRAEGAVVNLPDYALGALCAQTNRFMQPPNDGGSVLSTLDYGLLLDTAAYAGLFQKDAKARGVIETAAEVEHVVIGRDGLIEHVALKNGAQTKADLYIDCTGEAGQLISQLPETGVQSWTHWLPCDQIITSITANQDAPAPYVHYAVGTAGWSRFIATQRQRSESHLISSAASAEPLSDAQSFTAGHRSAFWSGNCVALGAAAAILDPLSPLSLHLLHTAVRRLIDFFPNEPFSPVEAGNYNRLTLEELECARDWAILPYKINGRTGEAFWDQCRNMAVPSSLEHKVELYKATGRIALYDGEVMEEADWVSYFDAQGIYPRRYDPAANGIPLEGIQEHFARIREIMIREVARIPFHHDYLQGIGR
jgi:tryptophan 7-halogenase